MYPKQKAAELLGILLLASSLLLVLSLVSYNGMDASASVASPSSEYANYVGRVGAWISDFLFQLVGLSSLALPFPVLLLGYRKLRGQPLDYPLVKFFGFSISLLASSAALTLLDPALPESVNFTAGGLFGILAADLLLRHLNETGTLVVLATALLLSLIACTRFSIDAALTCFYQRNWNIFSALALAWTQWRDRRRDRKKLARLAQEKRTVVARAAPRKAVSQPEAASPRAPEPEQGEPPVVRLEGAAEHDSPATPPVPSPAGPRPAQIVRPYRHPALDFLQTPPRIREVDEQELISRAQLLSTKCAEFDVHGRVLQIHPGPVVTTFEFKPDPGVKYSRITNLADDLCLALKAESVRIDRIPGKNTVGIEVPNLNRQTIYLREILEASAFQQSPSHLSLALGKLINGNSYVTDLTRMPHLLIAGATGSGKSVALNGMVCSILYKSSPEEVRFIMIDPKRLELGVYEDIPHLLTPIVTDPKQAANALNWAVNEMEGRYKLLAQCGVRNIEQFNRLVQKQTGDLAQEDPLPYIVLIVDELADLMMTAGKDVEASVTRLAQMARAIGIHLILATQRPSVDVLTGLIKANFPCRISFRVSSKIDSRTILDGNGAERLLGEGDMLFLPPGTSRLVRIHGAFLSEREIQAITEFLKKQAIPEYQEEILESQDEREGTLVDAADLQDELYQEAARFVVETGKASTSLLQRRLRIGYGRAARLLDMMEHQGLIGPPDGSKAREVLAAPRDLD